MKQEALNIKNLESYLGPIGFTLIGAVAPLNWVLLSKILRGIKVRRNIVRFILALSLGVLSACAPTRSIWDKNGAGQTIPRSDMKLSAIQGTPFGPAHEFVGSPYEEIVISGLFKVHSAKTCRIAVLPNGDNSFSARIQALKKADTSV